MRGSLNLSRSIQSAYTGELRYHALHVHVYVYTSEFGKKRVKQQLLWHVFPPLDTGGSTTGVNYKSPSCFFLTNYDRSKETRAKWKYIFKKAAMVDVVNVK